MSIFNNYHVKNIHRWYMVILIYFISNPIFKNTIITVHGRGLVWTLFTIKQRHEFEFWGSVSVSLHPRSYKNEHVHPALMCSGHNLGKSSWLVLYWSHSTHYSYVPPPQKLHTTINCQIGSGNLFWCWNSFNLE